MRVKRRMNIAEFEAMKPLLNISKERIEAARLALVDGLTLQAIGNQFGWSRQAVGDAVNVVWKTLENYRESQRVAASITLLLPAGWEQVTLIAPTHLIEKIRGEMGVPPIGSIKTVTKVRKARKKEEGPTCVETRQVASIDTHETRNDPA